MTERCSEIKIPGGPSRDFPSEDLNPTRGRRNRAYRSSLYRRYKNDPGPTSDGTTSYKQFRIAHESLRHETANKNPRRPVPSDVSGRIHEVATTASRVSFSLPLGLFSRLFSFLTEDDR